LLKQKTSKGCFTENFPLNLFKQKKNIMSNFANIHDIADYIIIQTKGDAEMPLSHLKLQKLLYYVQAWYLANYDEKLFAEDFQAWIHGPVSREIFDRFKETKILYSDINIEDVRNEQVKVVLTEEQKIHIDSVLEVYMPYSGAQLETLSHRETPWRDTREGFSPAERCEYIIEPDLIKNYYKSLIVHEQQEA